MTTRVAQTAPDTHRRQQSPADTHRSSQTPTDGNRWPQTPTDTYRYPQTLTDTHRCQQILTDTHRLGLRAVCQRGRVVSVPYLAFAMSVDINKPILWEEFNHICKNNKK
ncbi:unnamed protein product [Diatraea saccharalis]|uniref:Uncharacterized protein n=1 Tax=Diatraea saccharalis TaxID=40085 RepID=A0A9N9R5R0_9NEOP|nr:unnamed protein product [Diatraea saccharalis]